MKMIDIVEELWNGMEVPMSYIESASTSCESEKLLKQLLIKSGMPDSWKPTFKQVGTGHIVSEWTVRYGSMFVTYDGGLGVGRRFGVDIGKATHELLGRFPPAQCAG